MSRVWGWTVSLVASPSLPLLRTARSSLLSNRISIGGSSRIRRTTLSHVVPRCSMSQTPDAMDFRVATYNVLCSHLAAPDRFPLCDPSNLDASTRLERIKQKLEEEVSQGAVICLQEVGVAWVGELHVFFLSRGYTFVAALYGAHFNNYMGVALAWPLETFEALTVDITRVSETRKWGRDPERGTDGRGPSPPLPRFIHSTERTGPLGVLMKLTGMGERESTGTIPRPTGSWEREPEDIWRMAEKRFNQALFARLQRKGGNPSAPNNGIFCVGTYHMPCLFNHIPVMVMHTSMVIKHLARLAGSDPLVFSGDFNFNPSSECYKLATEGNLSSSSPDFPELPEWEKDWSPETGVKLSSAYREVEGEEPNFTNNAKVEGYDPFIDTLDYIFCTSGVTATKVLPLKHRDDVQGPFPTADEPSDHVLLAAEFRIDGKRAEA